VFEDAGGKATGLGGGFSTLGGSGFGSGVGRTRGGSLSVFGGTKLEFDLVCSFGFGSVFAGFDLCGLLWDCGGIKRLAWDFSGFACDCGGV